MRGIPTEAQMNSIVGIVHLAIARNYPELSIAELRLMIDLGNYEEIFAKTMRVAGLVRKPGAPAPGESMAAAGTQSTQP